MRSKTELHCRLAAGGCCLVVALGLMGQSRLIESPVEDDSSMTPGHENRERIDVEIAGPVLGVAKSGPNGFRAIRGVPGSATLGSRTGIPGARMVASSAEQGYALASREDGQLLVARDLTSSPSVAPVAGIRVKADRIAISPSGTTVALYDREAQQMQVLAGLPDEPSTGQLYRLETLSGALTAIAVSDDGKAVLAIASQANRHSLVALISGDEWRYVTSLGSDGDISFLRRSPDAVISEIGANRVLLVRDVTGARQVSVLAGESDGVSRPVAVAASADKRRVIVANSAPGGVLIITPDEGSMLTLPCRCSPTGLQRLTGNALFLVNDDPDGILWLADVDADPPRIVFVPPGPEADQRRGAASDGRLPRRAGGGR